MRAETLLTAQASLVRIGSEVAVEELVADQSYHDNRLLAQCAQWQVRPYIPERKQQHRRWTDRPEAYAAAFRANRRRVRGEKGKRLNRRRSEQCERPFAHVRETGGGRRSWLRGMVNVTKAHVLKCPAFNRGLLLRKAFGLAKPRSGAALFELAFRLWCALWALVTDLLRPIANSRLSTTTVPRPSFQPPFYRLPPKTLLVL